MPPSRTIDELVAQPLMVSFTVVMGDEFAKRTTQVPLSERNEAEAFLCDEAKEPLRVCAAVRCPERYPNDPHTRRFEDVADRGAPLAIMVADQHSSRVKQT